jgi:alanyl-tRNA synthetase
MDSVRKMVDLVKERLKNNAVIVSSTGINFDDKILWAIGVTEDLYTKNIDASILNKEIGLELGGSGGGRKDFAQGGGNRPQNYRKALQKLKDTINKLL